MTNPTDIELSKAINILTAAGKSRSSQQICKLNTSQKAEYKRLLGILFSYHGISGKGWTSGAGLVKKFYLHKENLDERFCIIDFSFENFQSIYDGKNLLEIVEEQLRSLQFDTDYSRFISKHPAE